MYIQELKVTVVNPNTFSLHWFKTKKSFNWRNWEAWKTIATVIESQDVF